MTGDQWSGDTEDCGTITAAAVVHKPLDRLHPFAQPFAYVLVKLDGADTSFAHVVRDDPARAKVGARVQAVWAPDGERTGHVRDIVCFRVVG